MEQEVPSRCLESLQRSPLRRDLHSELRVSSAGNYSYSVRTASQISLVSLLQKGGRPMRSSKRRAPMQQQSTGQVCPTCRIISGDMYYGLPQKEQASSPSYMSGLASPRSAILTCPSCPSKMFSGLMSRQTTWFWWRQLSPRKISMMQKRAMSSLRRLYFLMSPKSSPPGQYSTTKMRLRSVSKANLRSIRKGCFELRMMLRSFMIMFFFLFLTITSLSITFMAQNCPSFLNRHRNTREKPPDPTILMMSKSSRVSESCSVTELIRAAGFRYSVCPLRKAPLMWGCMSRQSRVTCTGTALQQLTLGNSFFRASLMSPISPTSMKISVSSCPSITTTLQFFPCSCFRLSSLSFACLCCSPATSDPIVVDLSVFLSSRELEAKSLVLANLLPLVLCCCRVDALLSSDFLSEKSDFS